MISLDGFDAAMIEPSAFEVIPAGEYVVKIEESERKDCKTAGNAMLVLKLVIVDGPYKNRVLFDRLNLWNANETAKKIAWETMAAICHAVGILKPPTVEALHGLPMVAKVIVEDRKDKPGEQSNRIKGYKARAPVAPPPAQAPTTDAPKQAPWART